MFKYVQYTAISILLISSLLAREAIVWQDSDDRVLLHDITNEYAGTIQNVAKSVCLIVKGGYYGFQEAKASSVTRGLSKVTDTTITISSAGGDYALSGTLGEKIKSVSGQNPCENVKFKDQKVGYEKHLGPIGTGALIGCRYVISERHIFYEGEELKKRILNSTFWCIFDFNYKYYTPYDSGHELIHIDTTDFYQIVEIVKEDTTKDLAILRLRRCVSNNDNRTKFELPQTSLSTYLSSDHWDVYNKELFVLGHPYGMQMIYVDNSYINNDVSENYFLTFTDALPGMSGSPIMEKAENQYKLLGLLKGTPKVYPDYIFDYVDSCRVEQKVTNPASSEGTLFSKLHDLNFTEKSTEYPCDCPNVSYGIDYQPPPPIITTRRVCARVSNYDPETVYLIFPCPYCEPRRVVGGNWACFEYPIERKANFSAYILTGRTTYTPISSDDIDSKEPDPAPKIRTNYYNDPYVNIYKDLPSSIRNSEN